MFNHPNESQVKWTRVLTEQFQGKGYHCQEVNEQDATVLIVRTEKNTENQNHVFSIMNRSYGETRVN